MRARLCWFALLLPLLLTACGGGEAPPAIQGPPLDFSYLRVLDLNVATIRIEDRYVPSGAPPDVTQQDPISPIAALHLMAQQRLRAGGTAGQAVFVVNNASMMQTGETITGAFSVTLNIYTSAGVRAAFAQATVTRQIAGFGGDLQGALATLTRQLMQQMNVEFEYRVRRSLGEWLLPGGAAQPVTPAPPPTVAPPVYPPPPASPPPPGASSGQPISLAPPGSPPPAPYPSEPYSGGTPNTSGLPVPLGPAASLPQPTTSPPPPMPSLPTAPPPAASVSPAPPPPPANPPLPRPLGPPANLPPPGPVVD